MQQLDSKERVSASRLTRSNTTANEDPGNTSTKNYHSFPSPFDIHAEEEPISIEIMAAFVDPVSA